MLYRDCDTRGLNRSGPDDIWERSCKPIIRFIYNNPIYTVRFNGNRWVVASASPIERDPIHMHKLTQITQAVILYAFVVSVHSLKTRGKALGPYAWQVHGLRTPSQKGSCFCK